MKNLFLLALIITAVSLRAQINNVRNGEVVTLVGQINKSNATNEGLLMNGYIVHLKSSIIEKLDGEKVKISGKVTVAKPLLYLQNSKSSKNPNNKVITRHIRNPRVQVLK